HLGREVALGPVPGRVDAERLHVDALRVHLANAPGPDLVDARASLDVGLQAQEGVRFRDHAVGVDVDGSHAAAAHDDLAPARAPRRRARGPRAGDPAALDGRSPAPLRARGRPRPGPRGGLEQIAPGEDDAGHRAGAPALERFAYDHGISPGLLPVMEWRGPRVRPPKRRSS